VTPEIRPASHLMRPSDEKIIFGSTEKFRKDTGWKPQRSIEQTLASMIEFWESMPSDGANASAGIQKLRWAGIDNPKGRTT